MEQCMEKNWEKELSCASQCKRCGEPLEEKAKRILSVYDHQPICMACKNEEEKQPDYGDTSKQMIVKCMEETNKP
jgi:hypothetical protein